MQFSLVDRILDAAPGKSIATIKALTLAEEYLADHFPSFPVMPGVLMVESMVQASAWLTRITDKFAHSIVVLQKARRIRFSSFVQPGQLLRVESRFRHRQDGVSEFSAEASVENEKMVSAQLTLIHYNLRDSDSRLAQTDGRVIAELQRQYALLNGPLPSETEDSKDAE
jgi:3-hydroxyacyl-[acyl-carrier-protein] dehydratase